VPYKTGNKKDLSATNNPGSDINPNNKNELAIQPAQHNSGTENFILQPQQPITGSMHLLQQPAVQQQDVLQPEHNNDEVVTTSSPVDSPGVQQETSVAQASKLPVKIRATNANHFYAGLMAGMDLSFVKYQQMEPLGYNAGLLVGYKFRKLSIESGLSFVKKNYYTEGEYFDKTDIPYFDDADILTVDGYCRMFEIPLNVKYNLAEKKNHGWFITGGLSSYLMNKEYYNYDYVKNGEQHYGSRAYYNATQNWFSVLNLSAGYELKTNTKTNLRIEPYFKAPLSGLGTGKLSISSIGINAGIIRHIP
jgi:hypothetical protein